GGFLQPQVDDLPLDRGHRLELLGRAALAHALGDLVGERLERPPAALPVTVRVDHDVLLRLAVRAVLDRLEEVLTRVRRPAVATHSASPTVSPVASTVRSLISASPSSSCAAPAAGARTRPEPASGPSAQATHRYRSCRRPPSAESATSAVRTPARESAARAVA